VAENDRPDASNDEVQRRAPDLFTLVVGLAVLCASAYVITDGSSWLPSIDPRWLVAGGALVVGLLLLVLSSRPGRRR
jgi:hypothetical protein